MSKSEEKFHYLKITSTTVRANGVWNGVPNRISNGFLNGVSISFPNELRLEWRLK